MSTRHLLIAVPSIAALIGPLIPGVNSAALILGLPSLLVWTAGWGVFGTTAVLFVLEATRPRQAAGAKEGSE